VPVHKTGTAFTKPVDPLLGQAIQTWQTLRPAQPTTPDRKTGEHVDTALLPPRPAGRQDLHQPHDHPGALPQGRRPHRRRARHHHQPPRPIHHRQPALQRHGTNDPVRAAGLARTPHPQHYAKITPNTLAKAYHDAGYFARNIRTIEVLLDRDAVTSGAAAAGQPWQHYDLGHGYCTYTFFEQCPHRMACARCDFYTPKDSAKAPLLQAKDNLQRILASVPLTDDERAAVEDDQSALNALLGRLTDVATPAGPTPRQIGVPPTATLLPIVEVNQGKPPKF
jgi:hypothetical protein